MTVNKKELIALRNDEKDPRVKNILRNVIDIVEYYERKLRDIETMARTIQNLTKES